MKKTRIVLCILGIALTIPCIVLPVLGAKDYFSTFDNPYVAEEHIKILAVNLPGPLLLFSIWAIILRKTTGNKATRWWIYLLGLFAAFVTQATASEFSHDFSHSVFTRCSGIYYTVVLWLVVPAAAGLIPVWLMQKFNSNPSRRTSDA